MATDLKEFGVTFTVTWVALIREKYKKYIGKRNVTYFAIPLVNYRNQIPSSEQLILNHNVKVKKIFMKTVRIWKMDQCRSALKLTDYYWKLLAMDSFCFSFLYFFFVLL